MDRLMLVCSECIKDTSCKVYDKDIVPVGPQTTFATLVNGLWKIIRPPYGHVEEFLNEHDKCVGSLELRKVEVEFPIKN